MWSDGEGTDGTLLLPTYLIRWGQQSYVPFSIFILILSFGLFCFLWWKTMDDPWSTKLWDVRAYCSAFPCIVLDLEFAQGSSGRSLGRFQINYPRSSAYDTSPCGTSSLETGVVLRPQLDVRWNFLISIHRGLFPSEIPSGISF